MRLDLRVRPRKYWSYPQFRLEIPVCERVRGYGERIRTQGLGCPRAFESAAIGGSKWLKNIRVRPTALSAKKSVHLKATLKFLSLVAVWRKASAQYAEQKLTVFLVRLNQHQIKPNHISLKRPFTKVRGRFLCSVLLCGKPGSTVR